MFEKMIIENLLAIVAAYRKETGRSLTAISKEFYGRGDFFEKLKQGQTTISVARLSTMLDKFRDDWPEGSTPPFTRPVFMAVAPKK